MIFLSFSFFVGYIAQIPFIGKGKLLPDDYTGGLVIIPIILLAYWFNGMYNNFSASLHIAKKTKYLRKGSHFNKFLEIKTDFNYGNTANQVEMLKADFLHKQNLLFTYV